jgi:hypothetical protein
LVADASNRQFSGIVPGNDVRSERVPIMHSDRLEPDLLQE